MGAAGPPRHLSEHRRKQAVRKSTLRPRANGPRLTTWGDRSRAGTGRRLLQQLPGFDITRDGEALERRLDIGTLQPRRVRDNTGCGCRWNRPDHRHGRGHVDSARCEESVRLLPRYDHRRAPRDCGDAPARLSSNPGGIRRHLRSGDAGLGVQRATRRDHQEGRKNEAV